MKSITPLRAQPQVEHNSQHNEVDLDATVNGLFRAIAIKAKAASLVRRINPRVRLFTSNILRDGPRESGILGFISAGVSEDSQRQDLIRRIEPSLESDVEKSVSGCSPRITFEATSREEQIQNSHDEIAALRHEQKDLEALPKPELSSFEERRAGEIEEKKARDTLKILQKINWRVTLALFGVAILCALEGGAVYFSLEPLLADTSPSVQRLLPVLCVLLTITLLFTAERLRLNRQKTMRFIAGTTLVLTAAALAVLRVGILDTSDESAASASIDSDLLLIGFVVFVPTVVVGLLGAEAFKYLRSLLARKDAIHEEMADEIRDATATLQARKLHAQAIRDREKERLSLLRSLPKRIRLERASIREEYVLTEAAINREARRVQRELKHEIKAAALLIATWTYDERNRK